MNTKRFKDFLASSGPDKPKTPARSRAQRHAEVAPRVAAELLEARRLFAVSSSIVSGVLVVVGDSSSQGIEVYGDGGFSITAREVGTTGDFYVVGDITAGRIDVYGGSGNDTINLYGGPFPDGFTVTFPARVYGEDGNDFIDGGEFADSIWGGVGYDTIHGHEGTDVIYGGTGSGADSDSVTGYDSLFGEAGNDTIYGEGGGDTIDGGGDADYVNGGDFGDSILGGAGADYLTGSDGNDTIIGGEGADSMYGDGGDDTLDARDVDNLADILNGGNGNDCGWWTLGQDSDTDMEGNFE